MEGEWHLAICQLMILMQGLFRQGIGAQGHQIGQRVGLCECEKVRVDRRSQNDAIQLDIDMRAK